MTYEDWFNENYDKLPHLNKSSGRWGLRLEAIYNKQDALENMHDLCVHISWSMGGSMNDCWDDSYNVSGEVEPVFIDLDKCVELMNPNLTYMQYRLNVLPLIETDTSHDSGYYGGSVTYGHKQVNLYKLWQALMGEQ